MSSPVRLARPSILSLRAYKSARSLVGSPSGASGDAKRIFLDANESPEGEYNRYPQPQPAALIARFSSLYGVPADRIIVGRGSDEAIDLLTRAFCEPGQDEVVITPPTYGMYEVAADIQNVRVTAIPLLAQTDGWDLDLPSIKRHIESSDKKTKLVYICSPNNPTGTLFSPANVRELCEFTRDRSLVVIDEAYAEFNSGRGLLPLLEEFRHVVVLRTLSKAWALAGLRCGVAIGDPELITLLQKVRAPYPLPQPVIDLALQATDREGQAKMQTRVQMLVRERELLMQGFKQLPTVVKVFPSAANFILVRFQSEAAAMQAAARAGFILRSRANEIADCVRISIGTPAENQLLLKAMGK